MQNVLIFGGTTEGREEAVRALGEGHRVTVCVTSEYARQFLPEGAGCRVGAMDGSGMLSFMRTLRPDTVIDATHPFAVRATRTIRACCEQLGIPCRRLERPADRQEAWHDAVIWADSPEDAAAMLKTMAGNILLTTGSNTASVYAEALDTSRLFVRVLPTLSALQKCMDSGIVPSHIIAMQGPFSREMNAATYAQFGIDIMVSKDSGDPGSVTDKVLPALAEGIAVVMIRRPKEDVYAR